MNSFDWSSLVPLAPEAFLAVVALFALLVGVATTNSCAPRLVSFIAFTSFLGAAAVAVCGGGARETALGGFFIHDQFGLVMKVVILLGMAAVVPLSLRYIQTEGMRRFEYPVLLMFITLGMMAMVSAYNLLSLYMALELQSLSIYVLAAFRRDDGRSSEAGLKYFILGALSSGMLLFGISLIYGYTGQIGYDEIAAAVTGPPVNAGLLTGLVFVIVGIAFKISAAPFHMWTPDVYEGAPTSVTAMMAIAPKIAALAMLTRLLCGPFLHILPQWQQVVWALAALSMAWGSFAVIGQKNIKRLMAYSSISNMGYALIGLVAGTQAGIASIVVYLSIYAAMTAGVFAIILSMRRDGAMVEDIDALSGLSRTHPARAYAMAVLMFSMSGVPPLAGFFAKLAVFQAAIAAGLPVLAVLGVVLSVVAAYYYLRIIKIMFFDPAGATLDREPGIGLQIVMTLSVVFIVAFILAPGPLVGIAQNAARAFFAG